MSGAAAQTGDLEWRAGDVPASRRFADSYYAAADGLAEARHVFLGASGLAERLRGGGVVRIGELGFGTGLNLLAAWALARESGARIEFTSFEASPLTAAEMARAHRRWPELAALSDALTAAWAPGGDRFAARLGGLDLTVVFGDARRTLPRWRGEAEVWFLDGFAPARNPAMWAPELLASVRARTAPGGVAVTYSAAGSVRRGLAAAGFAVERLPGYGHKRHMTRAVRP